jgi:hypothetical protein
MQGGETPLQLVGGMGKTDGQAILRRQHESLADVPNADAARL